LWQFGILRQMGIFEVIPISEKIGKLILERASASDIEKMAKEEGMITLKQRRVLEGYRRNHYSR